MKIFHRPTLARITLDNFIVVVSLCVRVLLLFVLLSVVIVVCNSSWCGGKLRSMLRYYNTCHLLCTCTPVSGLDSCNNNSTLLLVFNNILEYTIVLISTLMAYH